MNSGARETAIDSSGLLNIASQIKITRKSSSQLPFAPELIRGQKEQQKPHEYAPVFGLRLS
jgi:hypothetical protein